MRELRADGGAAANHYLMQFQADLLSTSGASRENRGDHRDGRGDAGGAGRGSLEIAA